MEFFLQKLTNFFALPTLRVIEMVVQRKIALVKMTRCMIVRFRAENRHIKNCCVNVLNAIRMVKHKFYRSSGLCFRFIRRAEEEVDKRGDARF